MHFIAEKIVHVQWVHLQQMKGMQSSKLGMWKGYHLPMEGVWKRHLFCQKMVYKWGLGVRPQGGTSPYKTLSTTPTGTVKTTLSRHPHFKQKRRKHLFHPLSPKIHIPILQTNLHTFHYRKFWLRNFDKRSKYFPFSYPFSWLSIAIFRRKLILVTFESISCICYVIFPRITFSINVSIVVVLFSRCSVMLSTEGNEKKLSCYQPK